MTVEDQAPTGAPYHLRVAAVSDVGRHRKENQDSGYASQHLLVIADGVGGAAYGDVASSTAVHLLKRLDTPPDEEMLGALAGAVHRVHDRLAEMVEQDGELDGTSTTVTAALFDGHRLGVAHVGDSRGYLWRGGEIQQVTKDHTFVQTLIDEGRISEPESRVHPHRNIILRAVDGVHDTEPDLFHVELEPGDRVLLCSDGCSGAVTDDELAGLLAGGSVEEAATSLVQAALDGGTTDNVTVVVAEVVATGGDGPTEPLIVGAAAAQPRRGSVLGRFRGRQGEGGFRRQQDAGRSRAVAGDEALVDDDEEDHDPADDEELRYAPRPPRKHPLLLRVLLALVVLAVVAGVLFGAYTWSQHQYYVAEDGTHVAIYQGVRVDLPGITLSHVYEKADVTLTDLPDYRRQQVQEGIVADDLSDAHRILQNLEDQVKDPS